MNQYSRKFKQNLIFQNTITFEITDKERSKLVILTYTPDCIAGSAVCGGIAGSPVRGLPVTSIWPVTDLIPVTECSLAQC